MPVQLQVYSTAIGQGTTTHLLPPTQQLSQCTGTPFACAPLPPSPSPTPSLPTHSPPVPAFPRSPSDCPWVILSSVCVCRVVVETHGESGVSVSAWRDPRSVPASRSQATWPSMKRRRKVPAGYRRTTHEPESEDN